MAKPRLLDLFCGAGGAAMGPSHELAWAAGFFDGEGSVHVARDKRPGRRLALQLNVEQVRPEPLARFLAALGRDPVVSQRPARGGSKPIYRVCMGHANTVSALRALWPYLSEPKREQAERCWEEVSRDQAQAA